MENILGKNWLTTLGGLISAVGACLALLPKSMDVDPAWGAFIVGLGAAVAGVGAKSFNVHSTDTEVMKTTIKEDVAKDKAILDDVSAKMEAGKK
jgi:hypothetical protein